jgi:hypothetical protein
LCSGSFSMALMTWDHVHVCVYEYMFECTYVCMCACVTWNHITHEKLRKPGHDIYIYIYIYIHKHTYTHINMRTHVPDTPV